jgi:predicted dehydrogenase
MTENQQTGNGALTRRTFLTTTSAVSGALVAEALRPQVFAAGSDMIKVGVIGCGGRGSGAAGNVLHAARGVQIIALGDAFTRRVERARNALLGVVQEREVVEKKNSVDLPESRCFTGLDAYKKVLATPGVNYVILATAPGFRPLHIEAAVAAGKNIFAEKPVGTDGPGIRQVLAAYEASLPKGLCMVAGTQRRHQNGYLETIKRIHDGAIGKVILVRAYWNGGGIWFHPRKELDNLPEPKTDVAYQLHNWYHFCWLSGDHICEQHIHNLDVANWVMNAHPLRCWGMGSRTPGNKSRPSGPPAEVGNIFDNFSIEYEYPDQDRMISQCRHIANCWEKVGEFVHGTKGTSDPSQSINNARVPFEGNAPLVQEHTDLIEAIRTGKKLNEMKNVAESTLTAIMGRMAAYTGKEVSWERALNSKEDLVDEANLTWDTPLPVPPVPIPGKTPLV